MPPQQAQTDPWEEAAKQFKPSTQAAPQTAGGEDWKLWQPASTDSRNNAQKAFDELTTVTPEQDATTPAMLRPLAHFGAGAIQSLSPVFHPVETVKGLRDLASAFVQPQLGAKMAGDAISTAADRPMQTLGNLAGGAALTAGAGELAESAINAVPSATRAGAMLSDVERAVGTRPVSMTRTLPAIEEAQRLSDYGHGTIGPLDKLYQRMQTINPIDYSEARGRYSPLRSLITEDKMRSTPTLQRAAKSTAAALRDDIGDVAREGGVGDLYEKGLTEYQRAMQLRDLINSGKAMAGTTVKRALPYAAGGLLGYEVLRNLIR